MQVLTHISNKFDDCFEKALDLLKHAQTELVEGDNASRSEPRVGR